ncbi:RidA family protein [Microbacterium sp.]|uniref:RidA family protein n=1 Tax=Microbacterium sp. TaxID=51671 RepID=UPI003F99F845
MTSTRTDPVTKLPVRPRITHVTGSDAIPGISQAVIVERGRIAYLSGHLPLAHDGAIPTEFTAQLTQTFSNINEALNDLGATTAGLIRITIYVVGLSQDKLPLIRAARDTFIGGTSTPPASALLGVAALFHPEVQVEIDAIVSLPNE